MPTCLHGSKQVGDKENGERSPADFRPQAGLGMAPPVGPAHLRSSSLVKVSPGLIASILMMSGSGISGASTITSK